MAEKKRRSGQKRRPAGAKAASARPVSPAGLTPKQQRFVDEYLIDLNATQAAIRAGYSPRGAEAEGCRLLRNVKVSEAVQEAMWKRCERTGITADRTLLELSRIGYGSIRRVVDWGPDGIKLKKSSDLDEDAAACVAEVSETITKDGGSQRVKTHDKVQALIWLGKHQGLFPTKTEVTGPGGAPVPITVVEVVKPEGLPDAVKAAE